MYTQSAKKAHTSGNRDSDKRSYVNGNGAILHT